MRYFITYGDNKFINSKKRIEAEANNFIFDEVTVYSPEILSSEFKENFKEILKMKRGGGYMIWKPYIIFSKLLEIKDNDILVYLDAGCHINKEGLQRYYEYEEKIKNNKSGILATQLKGHLLEKYYTTQTIFDYFNITDKLITDTPQIQSGIIIIRKCDQSVNIISKWLETVYKNPMLFTDIYNEKCPNYFIDNRHDQSIFSVIMKLNNGLTIPDETWVSSNWGQLKNIPFWATRIRT